MTSNNEFIKEFEEKFVSRTKSISGLISLWWLGIFGEHNDDTTQIECVEDFILKILEQKDEEWSQLNLKVAKEALKQGADSMKEEILSKLPEETKDIKNSGESRVSGAMYALEQGRNLGIQLVKNIIKNV